MLIHNFEQGTPEWHEMRKLKMTASHAQAIGSGGKGLKTLIQKLCCDFIAIKDRETYQNEAMERGNEQEMAARTSYELETGFDVVEVGFVQTDTFIGCSPDGLVTENGLTEFKSHNRDIFFKLLLDKKIDSKYLWQMQMQMLVCERKWCDFVAFCEEMPQKTFIKRIYPDEIMQERLREGLVIGKGFMRDILTTYNSEFKDEKVAEMLEKLEQQGVIPV